MSAPGKHGGCPAVKASPDPRWPGSFGVYVTEDGVEMPLYSQADVEFSYEVIADIKVRQAAA